MENMVDDQDMEPCDLESTAIRSMLESAEAESLSGALGGWHCLLGLVEWHTDGRAQEKDDTLTHEIASAGRESAEGRDGAE